MFIGAGLWLYMVGMYFEVYDATNQDVPYSHITGHVEEKYVQETLRGFKENLTEFFKGRDSLSSNIAFVVFMSHQCKMIFNQSSIINSLKEEAFDIAVIDASNPCTFLFMEKIGKPFIAFFPTYSANAGQVGIPSPLSYVPFLGTRLPDQMDFFQRVQNVLGFIVYHMVVEEKISSMFNDVIEENFPEGPRPSLSELYKKAELWIYNSDFAIDFPRPLLPHVIYVGGLLSEAPMHVSPELEDFISESGEAGFIIVALGSIVTSYPVIEFVQEMNGGLAKISQKVIWKYQQSDWPKEVKLAPNVKLMDWIPQNDLLGHPKVRLLVTHGGMNSLQQAMYHGVPVLGIPLFADQHDNLVRVKAKKFGTFIQPDRVKAELLADTIKHIIDDKSYKATAMHMSLILRSQPFPPDQQILRWVEHIIQVGGASHLHPSSYQQPWYQQYLLDVILFLLLCVTVTCYLTVKVLKILITLLCSVRKEKTH
ncbi:hypothetical protein GDO86_002481 [Hymenochirus boettgeri]|uniref:UDP-glucuronosyltransferase n=1 Tax=Hymenochirus boettgeri TaxID=247094 RepID=A0A8T2KQT3_9PIPI|nr:hypothetical protein GDO86_002481 [Hymenochirus boettgeri]